MARVGRLGAPAQLPRHRIHLTSFALGESARCSADTSHPPASVSVSIYSPCPLPLGELTTATMPSFKLLFLLAVALLVLCPAPAAAFGAGNIASISTIEGKNWRHGDIEDMLKTVACLKGHKWSSMMIKRVYFGNWLRDYSQAVDVGTLKGVQADTIRILVWVLAFMSFGYATKEFEVTHERLGGEPSPCALSRL